MTRRTPDRLASSRLALAGLLLAVPAPAAPPVQPDPLGSLVAAERAFSRDSVERGMREAFLAAFADDGVSLNSGPSRPRETLAKKPPTPGPAPFVLAWEPVWGAVSADGLLGFTTGPYTLTPRGGGAEVGTFSSVWRREAGGPWKVIVDVGSETGTGTVPSGPFVEALAGSGPAAARGVPPDAASLERGWLEELRTRGARAACAERYAPAARLHRDGRPTAIGREAACAVVAAEAVPDSREVVASGSSSGGDLAWAWGKLSRGGSVHYFLHVLRADGEGRLRVVLDVEKPGPPPPAR